MEINKEIVSSDKNSTFIVKQYLQDFFTSPRHYHREYEIAYIEESHGKLFVGNNVVDYNPGQIFIFAPRLVHSFKTQKENIKENKKAKATIILFRKEFLGVDFYNRKESFLLNKLLSDAEEGIQLNNPDPKIIDLIKNLSGQEGLTLVINLLTCLDYLSKCTDYKLLTIKWFKKQYFVLKDHRLNEILDYIEKNYKKINYGEITQIARMTKPAFSRYFKNKTEKTFTQYVNEIRIANARKFLLETNKKIIDISTGCGFQNLTYFNRMFKQINNITPRHFRDIYSSPEKVLY